eukprot:jgi/Mesen1/1186/ME000127S00223
MDFNTEEEVRRMKVLELIDWLSARGVSLPSSRQRKEYYLDMALQLVVNPHTPPVPTSVVKRAAGSRTPIKGQQTPSHSGEAYSDDLSASTPTTSNTTTTPMVITRRRAAAAAAAAAAEAAANTTSVEQQPPLPARAGVGSASFELASSEATPPRPIDGVLSRGPRPSASGGSRRDEDNHSVSGAYRCTSSKAASGGAGAVGAAGFGGAGGGGFGGGGAEVSSQAKEVMVGRELELEFAGGAGSSPGHSQKTNTLGEAALVEGREKEMAEEDEEEEMMEEEQLEDRVEDGTRRALTPLSFEGDALSGTKARRAGEIATVFLLGLLLAGMAWIFAHLHSFAYEVPPFWLAAP